MIWECLWADLIPRGTFYSPSRPKDNILKWLQISHEIRARIMPLLLRRVTFDVSSSHAPPPSWLRHAQSIAIQPSQTAWTMLASASAFFPRLKSATLILPVCNSTAPSVTFAEQFPHAVRPGERQMLLSMLLRRHYHQNKDWQMYVEHFRSAACHRQRFASTSRLKLKLRMALTSDAWLTVDLHG